MRYMSQALVALAALTTAACESSVYSVTQERLYSPARAQFAQGAKNLRTFVIGNPFDASQELINHMIIEDMRRGMRRVDTSLRRRPKFTIDSAVTDAADTRPEYWVALALNPAAGIDAAALCADPKNVRASSATAPSGRIEARMVFCYDGRVLSTTHGELEGIIEADDPRFHHMIATMTRELFPYRKYRRGFDDGLL